MKRVNYHDCKEIKAAQKLQELNDETTYSIPFPFFKYVQHDLALILLAELWEALKKDGHPIKFNVSDFQERHNCSGELYNEFKLLDLKGFIKSKSKRRNELAWSVRLNLTRIKKIFKEGINNG